MRMLDFKAKAMATITNPKTNKTDMIVYAVDSDGLSYKLTIALGEHQARMIELEHGDVLDPVVA